MLRSLAECTVQCQKYFDSIERQKAFRRITQDNIADAQAKQKFYADRRRQEVNMQLAIGF